MHFYVWNVDVIQRHVHSGFPSEDTRYPGISPVTGYLTSTQVAGSDSGTRSEQYSQHKGYQLIYTYFS
jgi:hypothetical protein